MSRTFKDSKKLFTGNKKSVSKNKLREQYEDVFTKQELKNGNYNY